ncbi:MAG: Fe-S-containing hydro-lyase [Spirochaetota bacterium]|nr:MAG: Fe-S-containing hydro-lyase [Spirochaetota bacterium]
MEEKKIEAPLTDETVKGLNAGDQVLLSGIIYTARDAAHKRLVELLEGGNPLPFNLKGSVIYYVGPSPAPPGFVIGAAGPTTSYRMDPYAPLLIEHGMKGMIGKGQRSDELIDKMKERLAVYFGATGGAAALISKAIVQAKVIAFDDLGTEAVRELAVKDMPLVVINDCYGGDLYIQGREQWSLE